MVAPESRDKARRRAVSIDSGVPVSAPRLRFLFRSAALETRALCLCCAVRSVRRVPEPTLRASPPLFFVRPRRSRIVHSPGDGESETHGFSRRLVAPRLLGVLQLLLRPLQ
jgi:hypothetical protein